MEKVRSKSKLCAFELYRFPKKENIRQAWIETMGKNFVPTTTSVLCSQHFSEDCFYYSIGGMKQRTYLKPGSVPTIFDKRFFRYA